MIDIDTYFSRIGYEGPRTPTLATLQKLHALHPQAIPFENLSPLLGQQVSLDLADIEAKLVGARRGGYCFEHGRLFQAVLDALGFRTLALAARVLWGPPPTEMPARCHMLLLVEIESERWIADAGFGGVTLSTPLRLAAGLEQQTPHGPFRLDTLEDGDWLLQVKLGSSWQNVYRFDLTPQFDSDYTLSNFYVSRHPESLFVDHLLAARVTANGRYTLFDGELNHYAQLPSRRKLADATELRQVLENTFGIRMPDCDGGVTPAQLNTALARCLGAS